MNSVQQLVSTPMNTMFYGGSMSAKDYLETDIQQDSLGALCFTTNNAIIEMLKTQSKAPCLHIPMQCLNGEAAICERWTSLGSLTLNKESELVYQYDENVLFGVLQISESDFQLVGDKTPLQQAAESAYVQIFDLIDRMQYPNIYRFWNYIPDINAHSYQLERYRQFNLGRHDAFSFKNRYVTSNVPAACALGIDYTEQAKLSVGFIAGRHAISAIENPRQISAYEYPQEYGPVSPTFSRAALVKSNKSELLLISGTASIVGHATQHQSDAVTQTQEAMRNINAIITQANIEAVCPFTLDELQYRVYVRCPGHLAEIRQAMIQYVGNAVKVDYLRADICREDLLLEIEASVEHPLEMIPTGVN